MTFLLIFFVSFLCLLTFSEHCVPGSMGGWMVGWLENLFLGLPTALNNSILTSLKDWEKVGNFRRCYLTSVVLNTIYISLGFGTSPQ